MPLPLDYVERVYAGVLGKLIGVYLGRPFEGWTYEQITARLDSIQYYVHDHPVLAHRQRGLLVVTDDDISGTFTFVRALADYISGRALTSAQIGQTWLNYIVEKRTTLWWGGLGNSTEHTAYLRLKRGLAAPDSGSMAVNGQVTAEQIGAQIFIDGWALVAPADPALAAELAGRAARVSHDGEAVYAAQLLAAMEAQAFIEPSLDALYETSLAFIPRRCQIYRLVSDLREWKAEFPDWRIARSHIAAHYGYDRYPGNCHVIPNHALIHLGLLYGGDNFQRAVMITNTSGWDTDCNSGNVGCLLGIKNGLAGIDAGPDWRGPVADRLYISSADGGRAITDAVTETYHLVNLGRTLAGEPVLAPKNGARFHFSLPGSVQGFRADRQAPPDTIENAGLRGLALRWHGERKLGRLGASVATFIPPEALHMPGYSLLASPTLYPGQVIRAAVEADPANTSPIVAGLTMRHYGADDELVQVSGPSAKLAPGARQIIEWRLAHANIAPIAEVGIEIEPAMLGSGSAYLNHLNWGGPPQTTFQRPNHNGTLWRQAWVNCADHFDPGYPEAFRLVQDEGTGLLITGTREWDDYEVSATLRPHMLVAGGLGARVQGLRRYYALLLGADQRVRLVKALDGEHLLAETPLTIEWGRPYDMRLSVRGSRLNAFVDGRLLFDVTDEYSPLASGGIALIVREGCLATDAVVVAPPFC